MAEIGQVKAENKMEQDCGLDGGMGRRAKRENIRHVDMKRGGG